MQATALDVAAEKVADRLIDEAGFWHAMAEVSFADMLEAAVAEVRRRLAEGHVYNGNGVCVSCERRHWDVPQP